MSSRRNIPATFIVCVALPLTAAALGAGPAAAGTVSEAPYEKIASGNIVASFGTVPAGQLLMLNSISCTVQATGLQGQTTSLSWGIGPSNRKTIYLPQQPVYGEDTTSGNSTAPTSYQVNLSFLGFAHAGEQVSVTTQTYRFLQPSIDCTLSGYSLPAV